VVGLGNPGKKYNATRHNIGREVVELLGRTSLPARTLVTESFMNESGHEVAREVRQNGLSPDEVLVVLDEFQIPLKQVKILKSGSDGGHNGLKSVLDCLGTKDVPRLRIGIGPLPEGSDPADFVLERFSAQEKKVVEALVPELESAVLATIKGGIDAAMKAYNNRLLV
jgi:PTH1 family peptidyl-tRNA hydrolase